MSVKKQEIEVMALDLLKKHLGNHKSLCGEWLVKFKWDQCQSRMGLCDGIATYGRVVTVSLSLPIAEANPIQVSKDTILHEIAHALTFSGKTHGKEWKAKCVEIGALPERTTAGIIIPEYHGKTYTYVCPKCRCKHTRKRRRNTSFACTPCCKLYNNGKYTPDYQFELIGSSL
jgi:hypothetical protein